MNRSARTCFAAALFSFLASAQDFSGIKFDKLADGYRFTEGPAWSKDGYLIFSDTPSDRLLKWTPGHATEVFRADAHGPSGNAFDADGRLYTCETRLGRVTRTDKKGKIEVLVDQWEGKRLNAPAASWRANRATSISPIPHSASSRTTANWISTASITFRREDR